MFRPWDEDPRPRWWARVQHETVAPLDNGDVQSVAAVLRATGMVRQILLRHDEASVTAWLLVKARSAHEAASAAQRIVEVAHHEAGHGLLGAPLGRWAVRQRR